MLFLPYSITENCLIKTKLTYTEAKAIYENHIKKNTKAVNYESLKKLLLKLSQEKYPDRFKKKIEAIKKIEAVQQIEQKTMCPICHDNIDTKPYKTQCDHTYHKGCIFKNFYVFMDESCCICRRILKTPDLSKNDKKKIKNKIKERLKRLNGEEQEEETVKYISFFEYKKIPFTFLISTSADLPTSNTEYKTSAAVAMLNNLTRDENIDRVKDSDELGNIRVLILLQFIKDIGDDITDMQERKDMLQKMVKFVNIMPPPMILSFMSNPRMVEFLNNLQI